MRSTAVLLVIVLGVGAILTFVALEQRARGAGTVSAGVRRGAAPLVPRPAGESSSGPDARRGEGPRIQLEQAGVQPAAQEQTLAAEREGDFQVIVVRSGSRQPVPGAEVRYWLPDAPNALERSARFDSAVKESTLDAFLAQEGELALADAQGSARFTALEAGGYLVAQAPELWGWARIEQGAPQPIRVELQVDWDLRARVRDAAGSPVPGVRVTLGQRWEEWAFDSLASVSDADGLATLRHAARILQQDYEAGARWRVGIAEALLSPVEASVDPDRPPGGIIELVLPEHGSCEVRALDVDGQAIEGPLEIALQVAPAASGPGNDDPGDPWEWYAGMAALGQVLEQGSAVFDFVGLDSKLSAAVRRPGSSVLHRAEGSGPRRAGERVMISVRLGSAIPIFAGRLTDPEGRALPGAIFQAKIEYPERRGWRADLGRALADDQGRFQLDANDPPNDSGLRLLRIAVQDAAGQGLGIAERALPAITSRGLNELGDLILVPFAPVAAGLVNEADGRPAVGAEVRAYVRRPTGRENSFRTEALEGGVARSDAEGRFEIRGRRDSGTILLRALLEDRESEQVEVLAGTRGTTLVLGATGEIAGSVLHDPSVPRRALGLRAHGIEARSQSPMVPIADDGSFVIRGLRPGSYRVCLMRVDTWDEVECVGDVLVRAGEPGRDRRLNPLDLSHSLRAFRLTVLDTEDEPIEWGSTLTYGTDPEQADMQWSEVSAGQALVFSKETTVRVLVAADGFLSEHIEIDGDRTVVLRSSPRVRVTLADGLRPPPAPFRLEVSFTPVSGDAPERHWFNSSTHFDALGVAHCRPNHTGELRVQLSLVRRSPNWTSTTIEEDSPRIVQIREHGEQVIELHLDPQVLAAAQAKLEG